MKLLASALLVGAVVFLLLDLMGIRFRPGYGSAVLVIGIAVVLCLLLTRIASKMRQRKVSP